MLAFKLQLHHLRHVVTSFQVSYLQRRDQRTHLPGLFAKKKRFEMMHYLSLGSPNADPERLRHKLFIWEGSQDTGALEEGGEEDSGSGVSYACAATGPPGTLSFSALRTLRGEGAGVCLH